MNISAYPRTPMLSEDNVFITDSQENGTKGIKAKMLASQLLGFLDQDSLYAWYDAIKIPVWDRRRVYRGKNLGDSVTPLQQARIRNGTFEDLFIGDYWVINGHEYVILDFDYYMGQFETKENDAETLIQSHHVTLHIRNSDLFSSYSSSSKPTGGYINSIINTEVIPNTFNPMIETDFGDHTQPVTLYLSNAVDNSGSISSFVFFKIKSVIPTVSMIFNIAPQDNPDNFTNAAEGKMLAYYLIGKPQPVYEDSWFRDIGNTGTPLCINQNGLSRGDATISRKITPIFSIQYGLQGG